MFKLKGLGKEGSDPRVLMKTTKFNLKHFTQGSNMLI